MKKTVGRYIPIFYFPKESKLCKFCLNRNRRYCNVYQEKCKNVEECSRYDVSAYRLKKIMLNTIKYKN